MDSEDDSAQTISEDEDDNALNIKPPQAKIFKHSHHRYDKHSSRLPYSGGSRHHKSHHRRHQEDNRFKDRDDKYKQNRHLTKDYDHDRQRRHHDERRKIAHPRHPRKEEKSKDDRIKSFDFEEKKSSSRSLAQVKEYEIERHSRRHHDEKKRISHAYHSRKDEKPIEDRSKIPDDERFRYEVVDAEEEEDEVEEVEEENSPEEEKKEKEQEQSAEESSSSDSSSGESSSEESSSEAEEEDEEEEEEEEGEMLKEKSEMEVEDDVSQQKQTPESEKEEKDENDEHNETQQQEETPPRVVSTNDDIDDEIELEKDTLPPYFPAIQGCRSVEEFQCLNKIEEGTYGVVYRAREKRTDKIVALKRLKMEKEKEGFPITSLREINTLLKAQHPNIVTVKEIVVGSNMDRIFIVMDFVEHDLKSLMETMKQKKSSFRTDEVKCLMLQLLKAVSHLHDNWILHRDLKTSNLLFSHSGILKVGDFGLAREYGSPLKPYTSVVVTLWYRAPELLLQTKEYSTSIDMWSVGCIFGELLRMEPLFPGKSEIDQLNRIFKALGTPTEAEWPDYPKFPVTQKVRFTNYPPHSIRTDFKYLSDVGFDLFSKFLTYDPKKRITAEDALKHEYFEEPPVAIDPAMFPTWPAKSDPGYRKAIASSPKPPSGGQDFKELGDDNNFYLGVGERNSRNFTLQSTFKLKF